MDRNTDITSAQAWIVYVALRKESVDRNINSVAEGAVPMIVALRKESVDRNTDKRHPEVLELGRSPQGERG